LEIKKIGLQLGKKMTRQICAKNNELILFQGQTLLYDLSTNCCKVLHKIKATKMRQTPTTIE